MVAATARWSFEAIGTRWIITTELPLDQEVRAAVNGRIGAYDQTWSRFRADSLVRRMAREAGRYELGPEAAPLFALYTELGRLTGGAVNPFVGESLEHLGYDRKYTFVPLRGLEPPVPRWEPDAWDAPYFTIEQPRLLDVGAAGKGQLVDLVSEALYDAGVDCHTIDASGDVLHHGAQPLRVGMEHPGDPTRVLGVVTLQPGEAICASATNRRTWGKGLHHVLDARTGEPTRDVTATWAVADSALVADGLATALFFVAPAALAKRFDVTCARMRADGVVEHPDHLAWELFA